MLVRRSIRAAIGGSAAGLLALSILSLPASGTSVPGLTATQVSLGAIVTQSGGAAADFAPYLAGERAYFNYVNNTLHGVNGRKLVLVDAQDDQSSALTNITDAHTLVNTDHVFAIVGIATAFFGAHTYLSTSGVPTFGYNTDNNWKGPKNFFSDYGSTINYATSTPDFAYVAKQNHATKVAVIALNYPSSQKECQPTVSNLYNQYHIKVVYSNLSEPIFSANFQTDAIKMVADGVDFVVSCMDIGNNIALSRAMQNQGMVPPVPQVWLDGYDRNILHNNATAMANVTLMIQHVPFEMTSVNASKFPGMVLYQQQMVKSGYASDEFNDVAVMGWESANLFTMGLRAAGHSPTRATVIAAINRITKDVGGPTGKGLATPTNWTIAHTKDSPPSCSSFVKTQGTGGSTPSFKPAFLRGSDPWICFPLTGVGNLNSPLFPPAGSPGL